MNKNYRKSIYSLLKKIPKGKVMTYKSVGSALGVHPRTVAVALKMNKDPIKIPCYKVVHSDGRIGGYSCEGGIKKKIELLKKDGIEIVNGRVNKRFIL